VLFIHIFISKYFLAGIYNIFGDFFKDCHIIFTLTLRIKFTSNVVGWEELKNPFSVWPVMYISWIFALILRLWQRNLSGDYT
jgi:hypothetical protein